MPYYRKLTPEEQAIVNKSMRKCWGLVLGLFGLVVLIFYMIKDYI